MLTKDNIILTVMLKRAPPPRPYVFLIEFARLSDELCGALKRCNPRIANDSHAWIQEYREGYRARGRLIEVKECRKFPRENKRKKNRRVWLNKQDRTHSVIMTEKRGIRRISRVRDILV